MPSVFTFRRDKKGRLHRVRAVGSGLRLPVGFPHVPHVEGKGPPRARRGSGRPGPGVQLVPTGGRGAGGERRPMTDFIDVLVPRGGKSLVARIAAESRVPVLKHLDGLCHVYVDGAADPDMATAIRAGRSVRDTAGW